MKCPLRGVDTTETTKGPPVRDIVTKVFRDCIKEDCAWWTSASENCCVKMASLYIAHLYR
jgi:hypothetical protein